MDSRLERFKNVYGENGFIRQCHLTYSNSYREQIEVDCLSIKVLLDSKVDMQDIERLCEVIKC